MKNVHNPLPWSIEAFRPYMTYEVLQEAVSVLRSFDGNPTNLSRRRASELLKHLQRRTSLTWMPERKVQFNILVNIEGSVFRRMKRVFTSFYLLDIESYDLRNTIQVTNFGKRLSSGVISREEFYAELIGKYSYPHPAYEDNMRSWEGIDSFYPFRFVIDTLFELENSIIPNYSGVSVKEFAALVHPVAHRISSVDASKILAKHYKTGNQISHTRTDAVDRKISDIFGFLAAIGVLSKNGNTVRANLKSAVYKELQNQSAGKVNHDGS